MLRNGQKISTVMIFPLAALARYAVNFSHHNLTMSHLARKCSTCEHSPDNLFPSSTSTTYLSFRFIVFIQQDIQCRFGYIAARLLKELINGHEIIPVIFSLEGCQLKKMFVHSLWEF